MKRYFAIIALLLAGFIVVPAAAHANKLRRMVRFLKLSPQQESQVKAILYKARRAQISMKAQLQLAKLDMHQLVSQHRPNLKAVSAAIDKVGKMEIAMKKSRIMMMLRVKATLTKQQAEKLGRFNQRRRMRRRMRRRQFRQWRRRRWRRNRWRRRRRMRRNRWRRRRQRDNAPPPQGNKGIK